MFGSIGLYKFILGPGAQIGSDPVEYLRGEMRIIRREPRCSTQGEKEGVKLVNPRRWKKK